MKVENLEIPKYHDMGNWEEYWIIKKGYFPTMKYIKLELFSDPITEKGKVELTYPGGDPWAAIAIAVESLRNTVDNYHQKGMKEMMDFMIGFSK